MMIRQTLLTIVAALLIGTACAKSDPTPIPTQPVSEQQIGEFTLVTDNREVCMVTNQHMGRPQIPVEVAGKTYYGCCAMCKGKLEQDASQRTAVDPVSQHAVDKAQAVIARNSTGAVFYFENENNFRVFAKRDVSN